LFTVTIENPEFLTVAEVAALLRVSNMKIYRMIQTGDLAAMQFGKLYRVPAAAVRPLLGYAVS
jgi:excisionase family DNA binding protein